MKRGPYGLVFRYSMRPWASLGTSLPDASHLDPDSVCMCLLFACAFFCLWAEVSFCCVCQGLVGRGGGANGSHSRDSSREPQTGEHGKASTSGFMFSLGVPSNQGEKGTLQKTHPSAASGILCTLILFASHVAIAHSSLELQLFEARGT